MVYSPCRIVDKTNWYAYLAQLKHRASLAQLGQAPQCTKAIERCLKIEAKVSPKFITYNYFEDYVNFISLNK
jgi:hypothetical protein